MTARQAVMNILGALGDRSGLLEDWYNLDTEIQEEIIGELMGILAKWELTNVLSGKYDSFTMPKTQNEVVNK